MRAFNINSVNPVFQFLIVRLKDRYLESDIGKSQYFNSL